MASTSKAVGRRRPQQDSLVVHQHTARALAGIVVNMVNKDIQAECKRALRIRNIKNAEERILSILIENDENRNRNKSAQKSGTRNRNT